MALSSFSTSNYLLTTTTPFTATPVSFACWFYPNSTALGRIIEIADSGASNRLMRINTSSTNQVTAVFNNGGGAVTTSTVGTMSTSTWYSCGASFGSGGATAYLSGTGSTPALIGADPASIDRHGIGAGATSAAPTAASVGDIAEVGMWNVELSAAEFLILAARFSPLLVRPASLKCYYPMIGVADFNNRFDSHVLTQTGTLTAVAHPAMIYPASQFRRVISGGPKQASLSYSRSVSPLGIAVVSMQWQSSTAGAVDVTIPDVGLFAGVVDRLVTGPGATAAPTDNYDLTIEDRTGADILGGAGANRDATAVETAYVADSLQTSHHRDTITSGPMRFKIANAGSNKTGIVAVYLL